MTTAPVQSITEELLAELEQKARDCTFCGEWYTAENIACFPDQVYDAGYVIAANPGTVLALIDAIRQQREELERLRAAPVGVPDEHEAFESYAKDAGLCIKFGYTNYLYADTAAAFSAWRHRAMLAAAPAAPVALEPVAWACTAYKQGVTEQRSLWHGEQGADVWMAHLVGRGCEVTKTPLYAAPPAAEQPTCLTCSGHGLVGGFVSAESGYDAEDCPDCQAEQPDHSGEVTDMVRCACGDAYPAGSYGAGFIDGSGMCENCDAAIPACDIEPAAEQTDTVKVPRELLRELIDAAIAEWTDTRAHEFSQDRTECQCCIYLDGLHAEGCAVAAAIGLLGKEGEA